MADKKKRVAERPPRRTTLEKNRLIIHFRKIHEVLPTINGLVGHFADAHIDNFDHLTADSDEVLGGARARIIVSGCAGSNDWSATLDDLGLDSLIFQSCVEHGVEKAGYVPPPDI